VPNPAKLNFPAWQSLQTVVDKEYFPASQSVQDDAPPLLISPLPQLEQELEPALLLYFPLSQASHSPMPAWRT
jgi:hypothetical protein